MYNWVNVWNWYWWYLFIIFSLADLEKVLNVPQILKWSWHCSPIIFTLKESEIWYYNHYLMNWWSFICSLRLNFSKQICPIYTNSENTPEIHQNYPYDMVLEIVPHDPGSKDSSFPGLFPRRQNVEKFLFCPVCLIHRIVILRLCFKTLVVMFTIQHAIQILRDLNSAF